MHAVSGESLPGFQEFRSEDVFLASAKRADPSREPESEPCISDDDASEALSSSRSSSLNPIVGWWEQLRLFHQDIWLSLSLYDIRMILQRQSRKFSRPPLSEILWDQVTRVRFLPALPLLVCSDISPPPPAYFECCLYHSFISAPPCHVVFYHFISAPSCLIVKLHSSGPPFHARVSVDFVENVSSSDSLNNPSSTEERENLKGRVGCKLSTFPFYHFNLSIGCKFSCFFSSDIFMFFFVFFFT